MIMWTDKPLCKIDNYGQIIDNSHTNNRQLIDDHATLIDDY